MPRVSKKVKRRRRPVTYTPRHIRELRTGRGDHFNDLFDGDLSSSRSKAWAEFRDEILPEFIAKQPGHRPHAWWQFDSPGRRERVDGGVHPHDRPNYPEAAKKMSFGRPACFLTRDDAAAEYEEQENYLRRHGLLLPEEM